MGGRNKKKIYEIFGRKLQKPDSAVFFIQIRRKKKKKKKEKKK